MEHVHVGLVVGFDVFQVVVRIIAEIRREAFVEDSGSAEIDSHEFYDGLTTASYRREGFNDFAPLVNSSFGDYLDELCLIRNGQIAWVFGLELVFFSEIVFKLIPYFLRDGFFFKSRRVDILWILFGQKRSFTKAVFAIGVPPEPNRAIAK